MYAHPKCWLTRIWFRFVPNFLVRNIWWNPIKSKWQFLQSFSVHSIRVRHENGGTIRCRKLSNQAHWWCRSREFVEALRHRGNHFRKIRDSWLLRRLCCECEWRNSYINLRYRESDNYRSERQSTGYFQSIRKWSVYWLCSNLRQWLGHRWKDRYDHE